MRITIDNKDSTAAWVDGIDLASAHLSEAAHEAGVATAVETTNAGRQDIASAGRFGSAWTQAFNSASKDIKGGCLVTTTMRGRRWRMFEEGRVVQGHPLLWIPFSKSDAVGKKAASYPGGLVQVTSRGGLPLLISRRDHQPKYFGKTSITIPQKFHLTEISKAIGAKIGEKFAAAYRRLSRNG